jgi:hypothetical protein
MRLRYEDHVTLNGKLNTLKVLRRRRGLVNCHYQWERAVGSVYCHSEGRSCVCCSKDNNGKQPSNKIRFRCWGSEEGKVLLDLCRRNLAVYGHVSMLSAPDVGAKFEYGRPASERNGRPKTSLISSSDALPCFRQKRAPENILQLNIHVGRPRLHYNVSRQLNDEGNRCFSWPCERAWKDDVCTTPFDINAFGGVCYLRLQGRRSWRWRQQVAPKRQYVFPRLYEVTHQTRPKSP